MSSWNLFDCPKLESPFLLPGFSPEISYSNSIPHFHVHIKQRDCTMKREQTICLLPEKGTKRIGGTLDGMHQNIHINVHIASVVFQQFGVSL